MAREILHVSGDGLGFYSVLFSALEMNIFLAVQFLVKQQSTIPKSNSSDRIKRPSKDVNLALLVHAGKIKEKTYST